MGALMTALLISFIVGPAFIKRLKLYQHDISNVRDDVPDTHLKKAGTPSMGGFLILFSLLASLLLWGDLSNPLLLCVMFITFSFGFIGFLDDYLKIKKKKSAGLAGKKKLALQVLFSLLALIYLQYLHHEPLSSSIIIPFVKNVVINLGWFFIPFCLFVTVGSSNAVNLTDGLDGLAIVPVMIAILGFSFIAYVTGNTIYSSYLYLPYIKGAGEITVFGAGVIGAGLGFLWFNAPPAMVFMGDTGSLALGGSVGIISIVTKQELILAVIGGLFVLEAVSVIIQVLSFKLTGKRIFAMAPIHHHFEKKGWQESTIVIRFWIIATILLLIGLSSLKIR